MGVKVKCQVTGSKVEKNTAYKYLEDGKKVAKYFTDLEHFNIWQKKAENVCRVEEYRSRCYIEIRKLLGVDKYISLPIHIKTRVKKWSEQVGYNGVLYAVDYVSKSPYTMTAFNSSTHKINYMMVQVENNLIIGSSISKRVSEHSLICKRRGVKVDYIDEVGYLIPPKSDGILSFL